MGLAMPQVIAGDLGTGEGLQKGSGVVGKEQKGLH